MVEESKGLTVDESVLNQYWVDKLIDNDVFEGDASTWKVTSSNFKAVLKAIGVKVEQFEVAVLRAINNSHD